MKHTKKTKLLDIEKHPVVITDIFKEYRFLLTETQTCLKDAMTFIKKNSLLVPNTKEWKRWLDATSDRNPRVIKQLKKINSSPRD